MKNYILYLEPYVYGKLINNELLLYNTLNYNTITKKLNKFLKTIVINLLNENNLLTIRISQKESENPALKDFVNELRVTFMGDVYKNNGSNLKPFQPLPVLNDKLPVKSEVPISPFDYVRVINVYINNRLSPSIKKYEKNNQFLWVKEKDVYKELSLASITKIIRGVENSNIKINLIGDLFKHSSCKELLEEIYPLKKRISLYLNSEEINNSNFDSILSNGIESHILFDSFKADKLLKKIILTSLGSQINCHFAISNINEMEKADKYRSIYKQLNFCLHPYYNGKNINFFKKNIFSDIESILGQELSMRDIYSRMVVNMDNYGEIYVMNNGILYANLNAKPIGDLNQNSIWEIIMIEIYKATNWKNVRSKVDPCKSCLYVDICPPISNYEYVLKKFDLCNIIK